MAGSLAVVTSKIFLDSLVAADVIRAGERIRRVVIDAEIGCEVMIHVERFGDARVLDVAQTLAGIQITSRDVEQGAGS